MTVKEAALILADGTLFEGEAFGADPDSGVSTGEVVFNTVMSGYQEVITDPSYAGQVITFTYPHIGNYGVAPDDDESKVPHCAGVVIRDLARRPSNWRSNDSLDGFLKQHNVAGIAGIDTRRLTRHIREAGSMPCAFGTADEVAIKTAAITAKGTENQDLASSVSTPTAYTVGDGPLRVVAYDFGIKRTILRHLGRMATVEVVPAKTTADEVMALNPDGVFLSNGPGDPAAVAYASQNIGDLLGQTPIFGICLGHQLLATALGAKTYKLPFGHHGGNHPVRNIGANSVEITSQNHNYAVIEGSLTKGDITHINLNDGVIEGLRSNDVPAFSVQYHPEAGPGPHDAAYLFKEFEQLIQKVSMQKVSMQKVRN